MATSSENISTDAVDLDLEPSRKRVRASVLCPHCDQYLSKSSYYRHKSSFYNKVTKQWLTSSICDGRPAIEVQQDCDMYTDDESTLEQTEDTDIDAGDTDIDAGEYIII